MAAYLTERQTGCDDTREFDRSLEKKIIPLFEQNVTNVSQSHKETARKTIAPLEDAAQLHTTM